MGSGNIWERNAGGETMEKQQGKVSENKQNYFN